MQYHRVLTWTTSIPTKLVCDLSMDDNSIHSCGTDVESVECCLRGGLNDVSKWCHQNRMVKKKKHGISCKVKTPA